jgi:hypothetical protein
MLTGASIALPTVTSHTMVVIVESMGIGGHFLGHENERPKYSGATRQLPTASHGLIPLDTVQSAKNSD